MKTTGSILKEARLEKRKSLADISKKTRIKERFLEALENCDWASLPNFTIAQGFAKAYAQTVGAEPNLISALLRRDFPQNKIQPKSVEMNFKKKSLWTPANTVFAVVAVTLLFLGTYLVRQYMQVATPPPLTLSKVEKGELDVKVLGKTAPLATVMVNGKPVIVGDDGSFEADIENQELINSEIQVVAESRTGKKSFISRVVKM